MNSILIETDPMSRLVQLKMIFRTGALEDPARAQCLSHFVSSMLLRGPESRTYREFTMELERLGGGIDVRTDYETTIVSATVLAENFDRFLGLLGEMFSKPAFRGREVRSVGGVVEGEIRALSQDPATLAAQGTLAVAYRGTRAAIPPEGRIEHLRRIRKKRLEEFYRRHFFQDGLVIGATSPFDSKRMEPRLRALLKIFPSSDDSRETLPPPRWRGRKAVLIERSGMATVPFFLAIPGVADGDPDRMPLEVANFVFGGDFTSRISRVLRIENGWTYGASSGFQMLMGAQAQTTLFTLYSFPSKEFASLALPKALSLLEEFTKNGVTSEEFDSAREALVKGYPFDVDTAEKRLSLLLRERLTGRPSYGPQEYRRRMERLTLEDVNSAIRRRLSTKKVILSCVGSAVDLEPILRSLPGFQEFHISG